MTIKLLSINIFNRHNPQFSTTYSPQWVYSFLSFFLSFLLCHNEPPLLAHFHTGQATWNEVVKKDFALSEISLPHEVSECRTGIFLAFKSFYQKSLII